MLLNCGVGEDSWESLDCKKIQSDLQIYFINSKGNQFWIFIGRTDAEAETPILWLPDVKNWLIVRDPDAGKDWRWEEKGITKDEMVGWHHWCDGHEFEQPLAVDDGWGRLAVLGSMGLKKSDTTEWLNWTEAELRLNDYRVINMQMRTILISELTGK